MAVRDHRQCNYHPDATFIIRHKQLYYANRRCPSRFTIQSHRARKFLTLAVAFDVARLISRQEEKLFEVCVRMPARQRTMPYLTVAGSRQPGKLQLFKPIEDEQLFFREVTF